MTKHDTVGLIYALKTYFLLLCTPSSTGLISLATSIGLTFAASEEAITMLLPTPMGLR